MGLSTGVQFLKVSISPRHRTSPPLRHFEANLPAFDRLLHPPSVRFLLHYLRADPSFHGGGGAYDPEAHDVPELPGREGSAELVPRLHGLLQRELRDQRLVGLRDRRVSRARGIVADDHRTDIHE